ncbi:MAG: hypothetical protein COA52_06135 [Hyphomicrobiales bacterium]|nr:MAG: hypothetical protein COA52_06135 [Hyphomicrobiales bacterium]
MALNLIKLCVGAETIDDLLGWIERRAILARGAGLEPEHTHTTRMSPKRREALLDGGSLYWVIKGNVQARQKILDLRQFKDGEGISRCDIVLDQTVVPTQWQPKRPFQGWRYFYEKDIPSDLSESAQALGEIPAEMRAELLELGLL